MMSLRRILGLMLLFLFFEAVVAVATMALGWSQFVLPACLVMTGLAVLTWLLFALLSRRLARPKEPKPQPALKAYMPAESSASADDSFTLELTGLIHEANRRLQALVTGEGRQTPTVQTMPLYLVLGPEGSGKTTAILNSGMEPRLLAGEAQKDGQVLPTGLANLWYAEGAIFLEIAGRVLMQEPERWEKALRILMAQPEVPRWKRMMMQGGIRTGSTLRGVLLACDTGLLVQSRDVHRLGSTARTLNERLQTVQSVMRPDFPTYVLLTHCDGVKYFQEFFAQLSEPESRRILGVTLPASNAANEYANAYADREGSRLTKLLNRLYQSLADKRLLLLAREEVIEKRALGYEFPREMKKLRGELVQFLLDAFRPSTLHAPCRLRGFYFSGQRLVPRSFAGVDSTSMDQSIVRRPSEATVFFHSAGRSSTLDYSVMAKGPVETRVAKWSFLTELFRDVILKDPAGRAAAALAPRVEDSRSLNAALGACGLVLLLLSLAWVIAWQRNHALLTEVEAAVSSTPESSSVASGTDALPQLEQLRPAAVKLGELERDGAPLSYHWGLYQGGRAAEDLNSLYYTRFRQAVLDPTLAAMTGHFLALQPDQPVNEDVYRELKVYRTITSGKCKPDEALVSGMMMPLWNDAVLRRESHAADSEELAEKQIRYYAADLKHGDPYAGANTENGGAVERAQVYLQDLTGPEKILRALLNQVQGEPAERLSDYAGNYSQVLTGADQMDGPYTSRGWKGVQDSIRDHKLVSSGEPCVVGNGGNATGWSGGMDAQVEKLYSDGYGQAWKQYLAGHHVVAFAGTLDAAQKLRTLADNNRSPLLALVYMTAVNTNVAEPGSLAQKATETFIGAATGAANTVGKFVGKVGGGPKDSPLIPVQAPVAAPTVYNAFDPVRAMVDPTSRYKWLNEKNQPYMKALGDLGDALQALPSQVHVDVPLEMAELQQAKTAQLAADSALHGLAANFPNTASGVDVDLQNLLREPIVSASRVISGVVIVKAAAVTAGGVPVPGVAAPAAPADPGAGLKVKATIRQVNVSALGLCSTTAALKGKFPFDANSTTDVTMDELNQLLQPGTGQYSQFANSPDVSKTFNHAGRVWAAKPEFPANYSLPFVTTLNSVGETADELYGDGSATPHVDLTLSVDGTGKIPFEVDVDGHTIKFTPGKPTPPVRLVWPPVTNAPTRLLLKTGGKGSGMAPVQWSGPWGLFHLLQAADDQSGNVFTFRSVKFANTLQSLTNDKGGPATVQIRIDSAASNIFSRGYFARLRCGETWAMQPQSPGN